MAIIKTFQCGSCGGSYPEAQSDGTVYFHACPPLGVDKNGGTIERPNRRDENVTLNKSGNATGIKAEGLGVQCLTDRRVSEPQWITKLAADTAKGELG